MVMANSLFIELDILEMKIRLVYQVKDLKATVVKFTNGKKN